MTPPAERRTAVIMGASSGIGRATAEAFAKKGWSLVLAARSREDLAIVASHCRTLAAPVLVAPTDVGAAEAVRAFAEVARRSEELRVGNTRVITCRSRLSP